MRHANYSLPRYLSFPIRPFPSPAWGTGARKARIPRILPHQSSEARIRPGW